MADKIIQEISWSIMRDASADDLRAYSKGIPGAQRIFNHRIWNAVEKAKLANTAAACNSVSEMIKKSVEHVQAQL